MPSEREPLPAITRKPAADIERSLAPEALEQLPLIAGDVEMLLGGAAFIASLQSGVLLARVAQSSEDGTAPGKSLDGLEKAGEVFDFDDLGLVSGPFRFSHKAATACSDLRCQGGYCAAASPPPLLRSAREPSRNRWISPSSTPGVLEVSTPVRRSLII